MGLAPCSPDSRKECSVRRKSRKWYPCPTSSHWDVCRGEGSCAFLFIFWPTIAVIKWWAHWSCDLKKSSCRSSYSLTPQQWGWVHTHHAYSYEEMLLFGDPDLAQDPSTTHQHIPQPLPSPWESGLCKLPIGMAAGFPFLTHCPSWRDLLMG